MLFFVDGADIQEIEGLAKFGIIDGVTTNPTLLAKTNKEFYQTIRNICDIITGPVSVEVASTDYDMMLKEGDKIFDIAENIVLKLPMTWGGVRACKHFYDQDKIVNMTLCFSAAQALIAAKAGAAFVSPFIGRIDDIGHDGLALIKDISKILSNYPELDTQILASSIRNPYHFHQVALIGVEAVTMPASIIKQLLHNPLTDKGVEIFSDDWKRSGLSI